MGAVHDASAVLLRGAAGSMAAPARDLSDQDVAARAECGRGMSRHAACELFWVIRYALTAGHGVEWVFMGAVHDASAVLLRDATARVSYCNCRPRGGSISPSGHRVAK